MRSKRAIWGLASLGVAVVLAGGCGGSEEPAPKVTTPPPKADSRPPLPASWRRVVNTYAGYNFGVPASWHARGTRGATIVKSDDRALALSVSADRSDSGLSLPPVAYARDTVAHLRGYRALRRGGATRLLDARYPAASAGASGTLARTGVRQVVLVFALQRPTDATFTLLFFRSARVPRARYATAIERIVRSFRAQPPTFAG